jgi:lipopolysaccharide export system permease protein
MILERYIHSEILTKLAWVIGMLVLILGSQRFVRYLADAAEGQLPSSFIFNMLAMKMLSMLPKLLPVALFLSVILAMTRLYRDRELTVVSSAGVSDRFQLFAVFRFSLVFSLVVAGISFYIAPWAELRLRDLNDRAEIESDVTGLHAGQFKEFSEGDRVVYVRRLAEDGKSMRGVFLQVRQNNSLGVLRSKDARYHTSADTGSRYVLFHNGRRYVGEPGALDFRVTRYRTYAVLLEQGDQKASGRRLEAIPTSELWHSNWSRHRAELQWRLSYVLSALLLPLLAVALSRLSSGDQRYTPMFIAILVYLIYANLLGISKTLMVRAEIPLSLGLWWVHGLLIAVIIMLLQARRLSFWITRRRNRATTA